MEPRVLMTLEELHTRLQPKIQEHLAHGVAWIWVIDPDDRRALSYSAANPVGTAVDVLRTENPDIAIALSDLLSVLD